MLLNHFLCMLGLLWGCKGQHPVPINQLTTDVAEHTPLVAGLHSTPYHVTDTKPYFMAQMMSCIAHASQHERCCEP